jgi:quinolinate synthase
MVRHLDQRRPPHVVMLTECSMSDNVAVQFPELNFIRPCNLCPHMKRITLPKVLRALEKMQYEVQVDADVAQRARRAVERMLEIGRGERS